MSFSITTSKSFLLNSRQFACTGILADSKLRRSFSSKSGKDPYAEMFNYINANSERMRVLHEEKQISLHRKIIKVENRSQSNQNHETCCNEQLCWFSGGIVFASLVFVITANGS